MREKEKFTHVRRHDHLDLPFDSSAAPDLGGRGSRPDEARPPCTGVEGTPEEWVTITDELVETGTFIRLNEAKKPNSFYCASDPSDVARVEDRTYICSVDEADAGPTNNWMAPDK